MAAIVTIFKAPSAETIETYLQNSLKDSAAWMPEKKIISVVAEHFSTLAKWPTSSIGIQLNVSLAMHDWTRKQSEETVPSQETVKGMIDLLTLTLAKFPKDQLVQAEAE